MERKLVNQAVRRIFQRHRPTVVIVCGLMLLLGWGVYEWRKRAAGEAAMSRLLAGDSHLMLKAVELRYQQRLVRCADREVLDFLSNSIRTQSSYEITGGVSYEARFIFSGDEAFTTITCINVFEPGFSLSLPSVAPEEAWPTHYVRLLPSLPAKVEMLFEFLKDRDVEGRILIMENGKPPRIERDASLLAH